MVYEVGRCVSSKETEWNTSEPKLRASQKSTDTAEKRHREEQKRGDRLLVTLEVGTHACLLKGANDTVCSLVVHCFL